jgi:hypothetical protein
MNDASYAHDLCRDMLNAATVLFGPLETTTASTERSVALNEGRAPAAGRCNGDWARGRPIARIPPRVGAAVLCNLLNWRRKSVTDELGRLSTRERNIGGRSTAAHAAATTRRTSLAIR